MSKHTLTADLAVVVDALSSAQPDTPAIAEARARISLHAACARGEDTVGCPYTEKKQTTKGGK